MSEIRRLCTHLWPKAERVIRSRTSVLVLGAINAALLLTWIQPWSIHRLVRPEGIAHETGYCYVAKLQLPRWRGFLSGAISVDWGGGQVSKLQLFEDGKQIGPPHSLHSAIREAGRGRYSHWGGGIFFSSSDNSNPSLNGRVYEVRYPVAVPGKLVASSAAIFFIAIIGLRAIVRKVLLPLGFTALGVATFVLPFELVIRSDYSKLHWLGVYGTLPKHLQRTLNSKGYRDDEHTPGKVHDRLRILILGDSMTVGDGLADDQIYPRLLASRLGRKVEIISIAQDGWSTQDQLAAFRREGVSYRPDIVVVAAVTNDPQPITSEPSGMEAEWVVFRRIPFNLDFFRFLDYEVNRYADLHGMRYPYWKWEEDMFDPGKHYLGPWKAIVAEFAKALKQKGIPGLAFIMISPVGVNTPLRIRQYAVLQETFANAGFEAHNLRSAFLAEFGEPKGKELWALPNDAHPGAKVNEFFAREMAKVLEPKVRSLLAARGLQP